MTDPHRTDRTHRAAMDAAIAEARASLREGGIPIGAALVDAAGAVLALGRNRRVQDSDPTAHAEVVCLRAAGRRRDWPDLILATTLSPCAMCSGAIVLYRVGRVVVGERRTFQGREDWLAASGVAVDVLDDPRCVAMMERFIREQPALWDEDIGVPPM